MQARLTQYIVASVSFLALSLSGAGARAADFGSPPAAEVPILFNDHTVYAKPDILEQARVLAALVKDGEIYVPLRSMFEQMGATVSVSADGKTITASKPGSSVSVTLGKNEAVIDGESRTLDVPPMLYHGVVLVPVRVISEAMGAYVQWVPERRVVVVRYIASPVPPPPSPAPAVTPPAPPVAPATAAAVTLPVAVAAPAATPVPVQPSYTAFIQAAYSTPKNYNEFVAGAYCDTFIFNAAYAPSKSPFALKADFRQDAYVTSRNTVDALGNQYTQFATIDGGTAFTPVFMARQTSLDIRLEYQVLKPRIYAGVAYLHDANNYGYPNLDAVGAGLEKLPDLRPGLSLYGSAFYYPSASGTYTVSSPGSPNAGTRYQQQYQIIKYDIGVALVIAHSPVYLFGGFGGDHYTATKNAPVGQIHDGPYIGLGAKI